MRKKIRYSKRSTAFAIEVFLAMAIAAIGAGVVIFVKRHAIRIRLDRPAQVAGTCVSDFDLSYIPEADRRFAIKCSDHLAMDDDPPACDERGYKDTRFPCSVFGGAIERDRIRRGGAIKQH